MNRNLGSELDHRHVDESVLSSFVQGNLNDDEAVRIENHLERCLACRVWATRLRHVAVTEPDPHFVSQLVESSPTIPAALQNALAASPSHRSPEVGELWRVGRSEALLVWVRRILDDSALVIPAVFDEDLADNFSLVVPTDESPIDVGLVLLTSVEGQVDLRAFLQPMGSLDIGSEVEALRAARKSQQVGPLDLSVGSRVTSPEDQRLEYRQVIADLLGELSPAAFAQEDFSEQQDEGFDLHTFVEMLRDLTWRRAGVEIHLLDLDSFAVDPAHELLVVGLIEDLDASVLVAVLSGAHPDGLLEESDVAVACGTLLRRYPDADHVSVSVADDDWSTVIVGPSFANRAVMPPLGSAVPPSVSMDPLPLVDAFLKHFDAYVPPWHDQERVEFDYAPFEVATLASDHAGKAVARLNASGRRSASPKKEVFVAFDERETRRVTEFVTNIVSGLVSPDEALDAFLEGSAE